MFKGLKKLNSLKEQYRLNGLGKYDQKEAEASLDKVYKETLKELGKEIEKDKYTVGIRY